MNKDILTSILGKKITVTQKLHRVYDAKFSSKGASYGCNGRSWSPRKLYKPMKVMVLGKRSLQNGSVEYWDEGNYFHAKERVAALLVIKDEYSNPFYVPIEELTK